MLWQCFRALLAVLVLAGVPPAAGAANELASGARVPVLRLDGPIGPASAEYVERGLADAAARGAPLVVIAIDTPGGLASATRDIVRTILGSPVPVAAWVAPGGARAASAGTYIVMASHVAAMAPATNIGAATPVSIGGGPSPSPPGSPTPERKDEGDADTPTGGAANKRPAQEAPPGGSAMERKVVNDSAAWMRALAQARGRDVEWPERAVREGLSISADEALEQGVIDFIAADLPALLAAADGREVRIVHDRLVKLEVAGLPTVERGPDWREELLMRLSDPTIAYLLLLVGAYAIFLEVTTPGFGVIGVIGGVFVLTGLFGLQMLPVNYVGIALIVFGFGLAVAEVFMPSFGLLGLIGTIAFIIGSIMLVDTQALGFGIPLWLIALVAVINLVVVFALARLAIAGWRRPVASGAEELQGARAEVIQIDADGVWVRVHGERWRAHADAPLRIGQQVRIVERNGLLLSVEALPDKSSPGGGEHPDSSPP